MTAYDFIRCTYLSFITKGREANSNYSFVTKTYLLCIFVVLSDICSLGVFYSPPQHSGTSQIIKSYLASCMINVDTLSCASSQNITQTMHTLFSSFFMS